MSTGGDGDPGSLPEGTAILSPIVGYMNNTRFVITLASASFATADSIVSVQAYDESMNELTPWTINSQYQDTAGMTITGVFTAGDGMPAPGSPLAAGISVTTGTIIVTTSGGVTAPVTVKPIVINPCD
jgi:hypothetical protein